MLVHFLLSGTTGVSWNAWSTSFAILIGIILRSSQVCSLRIRLLLLFHCNIFARRFGRHLIRGDYQSTPDVTVTVLSLLVAVIAKELLQLLTVQLVNLHVAIDHVQNTRPVVQTVRAYG